MSTQVIVEKNVPATMRDGTSLLANLFRPANGDRLPVLLTRTPYGKDLPLSTRYLDAIRLAERGYIVVVQDVRGRFASGGDFRPHESEFEDGYDTVAWAAGLPGANGVVGMWGVSYFGMTQWQAAVMRPPGLRALAPGITFGNYLNGVSMRGGARELGLRHYWIQTAIAPNALMRAAGGDPARLSREFPRLVATIDTLAESYDVLPLTKLPDPTGLVPYGIEGFAYSVDDPYYWNRLNIDGRYDQVDAETLHIGGWYDTFLGETLRQYLAMKERAKPGSHGPRLLIGPWAHGIFEGMVGDVNFGLASSGYLINYRGDLTDLHLRWFDATLKGERADLERQPPVEVFVMGENRWRGYPTWPVPGARSEDWYFHSAGRANTRAGDGSLSRTPSASEPPDEYLADPTRPVPALGGALLMPPTFRPGPRDQRPNEDRADVLCYTGAPLAADYTVIGPVGVTLHAASTAPDADFVARLVDVYPDERAMIVTDGVIRASARASYPAPGLVARAKPSPIEPERVYEYAIDLWATGIAFKAGHRIRVEIASSSFPRWDRNLQTGEDGLTSSRAAVARQRIFHDADHPSRLTLTVVDG